MRTLLLRENTPTTVRATEEELRQLSQTGCLDLKLRSGTWEVSAMRIVGAFRAGNWDVFIEPKLPMANVLALVDYVGAGLSWRDELMPAQQEQTLLAAVAERFLRRARRLLHQGLVRSYRPETDETSTIRGRVDVARSLVMLERSARAVCSYEAFDADIAPNQVLAAALDRLTNLRQLPSPLVSQARELRGSLGEVTARVARSETRVLQRADRRFARYAAALDLAFLIIDGSSLRAELGAHPLEGFVVDVATLYEVAGRRAFDEAARALGLTVVAQLSMRFGDSEQIVRPDLVVQRQGQTVMVLDTKYKVKASSENSMQMLTYMALLGVDVGALLYPVKVSSPPVVEVEAWGVPKRIHHVVLPLDVPVGELSARLLEAARAALLPVSGTSPDVRLAS